MRLLSHLLMFSALGVFVTSTSAQDYWEYDTWESEWEHHDPIAGQETEYENGIDIEEEAYEWEAGEGYHEEEWYDPSDWFDDDSTVDYEYDTDYGYDGTYDGY